MKTVKGIVLNSRRLCFRFDIEEDKTIRDFAKELRARNYPYLPSSDDLIFYLAKKDGRWLRSSDPEARVLRPVITQRGKIPASMEKHFGDSGVLDPNSRVRDFNFPDKENLRSDEFHVLLDLPGTSWYYMRVGERERERARQRRQHRPRRSLWHGAFSPLQKWFTSVFSRKRAHPLEKKAPWL